MVGSCLCGAAEWRSREVPESATACSCTACRRFGALWAYGWEGEDATVSGTTSTYTRGRYVTFHFCPRCGCVVYWRALKPSSDGKVEIGFNLRLSSPEAVARIPIVRFDGLNSTENLPSDGRCVADYWF